MNEASNAWLKSLASHAAKYLSRGTKSRRGASRRSDSPVKAVSSIEVLEGRTLFSSIAEFGGLTSGAAPGGVTNGPDGNAWFAEPGANQIGRISPGGSVTEFSVPTSGSTPTDIATGQDGNLWFTEQTSDRIGRITPTGTVTEFSLVAGSQPSQITTGADGNLWFTEPGSNSIGRIDTSGVVTDFALTGGSTATGIASGSDSNIWFTEYGSNNIGRIVVSGPNVGTVTEFASGVQPTDIAAGSDGNLWFTESGANSIGRITTSGVVSEFLIPTSNVSPNGIAAGPAGDLYFTEQNGNAIGRINTSGAFAPEYPAATASSSPTGITVGPRNHIWFTENGVDQVGRLNLDPSGTNDTYDFVENAALTVSLPGVLDNDTDPENDTLTTAGVITQPTNGTLTLNPDGSFTYTPNNNFVGVDSFTYQATDGTDTSNVTTVTLNGDTPPVAVNDSYQALHDKTLTRNLGAGVLANDTDAEANPLTAVVVAGPTNGTLTLNSNGSFTYTPNAGYSGSDSFTYAANDGVTNGNAATVDISVFGNVLGTASTFAVLGGATVTNTGATVITGNVGVSPGSAITGFPPGVVTAGQIHATDTTAVQAEADAATGYTTLAGTTAGANLSGTDMGGLTLTPGVYKFNTTAQLTGTLTLDAQGDPNAIFIFEIGTTLTTASNSAVLMTNSPAGVHNVYWQVGTSATLGAASVFYGSIISSAFVSLNTSATITLGSALAINGAVTMDTNTITVNTPPVTANDSFAVVTNTPLTKSAVSGVLANDSDVEGDMLTAVLVSSPSHGSLTLNPDGSFIYTPTSGYTGPDSFAYQSNDGIANGNIANVSITVDTPPVAVNDSYDTIANLTLTKDAAHGVLANDTDAEGNALTAVVVAQPAHGTVTLNTNGGFSYTPTGGYTGTDSFTYKNNDGTFDGSTATVNLVIDVATPTVITSANIASAFTGSAFSFIITTTGTGSHTLTESGSLPNGITFTDNGDGTATLAGTAASGAGNSYPLTITAIGQADSVTQSFTLNVMQQYIVTNLNASGSGSLAAAIASADAVGTVADIIFQSGLSGTITITAPDAGSAAAGAGPSAFVINNNANITIEGNGSTIKLASAAVGRFFAISSSLTLDNVNLIGGVAQGGSGGAGGGGGGGGGAGLGGAIFVNGSGATLTMNQSSIAFSSATGGGGGAFLPYTSGPNSGGLQGVGGGGGGGLGGNGANGGNSGNTNPGGGGGGSVASGSGQTGGNGVGGNGGNGGNPGTIGGTASFGGGGGGGGSANATIGASSGGNGGAGGFGGGGGASGFRTAGGAGGFGGGGGATLPGSGQGSVGAGGAFGGAGQAGGGFGYGGGGAGLGGAIFVYQGSVNLNNVSLVGNSASGGYGYSAGSAAGGAIFNYSGTVMMHNATLADNTATAGAGSFGGPNGLAQGAAIYNYKATGLATPAVTLYNSALAANNVIMQGSGGANAPVSGDLYNASGGTVTANGVNHNFIGASAGTLSGAPVLSGAAFLDFPGLHGGYVMTPPEAASPLVGAGDPSTSLTVDERGIARSNTVPTIGAYEGALPSPFPLPVGTVVVSEGSLGALIAIDPSTGIRQTISAANVLGTGPALVNPSAVTFDGDGNIYVVASSANGDNDQIYKIDPANGNRTLLSGSGTGTGTVFNFISAIAYNSATGALLVTDSSAQAIYAVSTGTGNRTLLSNNTSPNNTNAFHGPTSILYNAAVGIVEADQNFNATTYDSALLLIAGNGARTVFSDDANPSTANQIGDVAGIANAADGSILAIDQYSNPNGFGSHAPALYGVATTGTPGARTLLATLPATVGGRPVSQYGVAVDATSIYLTQAGSNAADTQVLRVSGGTVAELAGNDLVSGPFFATGLNVGIAVVPTPTHSAPTITSVNHAAVLAGSAFSFTFTTTGYPQATLVASGTLPSGVTFTDNGNGTATLAGDPAALTEGSYSLSVTAHNAVGDWAQTFTLVVDTRPVAVADSYVAVLNTPLTKDAASGLLANDIDAEGDTLTAIRVANANHGSVTVNPDGSFTYTPTAGYVGPDQFSYKANDGVADGNTVTVEIVVDTPPLAAADSYDAQLNTQLAVNASSGVLANDTDEESDPLTAVIVANPTHGGVTLTPNGSFSYIPNGNYFGSDSFTYKANDGITDGNTVTVTVRVDAPPVAVADAYRPVLNTTLTVISAAGVLANDTDADTDALTATVVAMPSHGTLSFSANGSFSYTPANGYTGPDSFTYNANDGHFDGNTVMVSLAVDNPPVGVADAYAVVPNTPLIVAAGTGVLANDTDADSDTLTATVVANPTHGTVALNANGGFNYVPVNGFTGTDAFTYRPNDGAANGNTTTVSLTVNQPPASFSDSYTTIQNTTLTKNSAQGVLANDTDLDGDPLTVAVVAQPSHGTLTLATDGSFVYVPTAGYFGSDAFTYKANDGFVDGNTATASIRVDAPPVAVADHYGTVHDTTLTVAAGTGVVANDTDPDADALTAVVTASPAHGVLTLNPDGSFTYVPTSGYIGLDSFTYRASDGITASATQTVSLVVGLPPVMTTPAHESFVVGHNGTFVFRTTGFPTPTLAEAGGLPSGVTFRDNGNGTATLLGAPAAGTAGVYNLTITVSNGFAPDVAQAFAFTVLDAPTITSATNIAFRAGQSNSFTVSTAGFPAPDLSQGGTLPAGVTYTDNRDGTATLAGTPTVVGVYPLTFGASNGVGADASQSFSLTVGTAPAVTSAATASYTAGQSGSFTITATGYPTASLSKIGTLPSGLTFTDNGDGTATVTGTPAAATGGVYTLSLSVSNGFTPDATQTLTLTVNEAPSITSGSTVSFTTGSAGSFTVTTNGFPAPALGSTGSLPAGLTFADNGNSTATIAGTPASGTGGTYTLTLNAANGVGSAATQTFVVTVLQAPAITGAGSSTFLAGEGHSATITATGFGTVALSLTGTLPAGIAFVDNGNATATLSGTAAAGSGGTYNLSLVANNGVGSPVVQAYTVTVNEAPSITSSATAGFATGASGSFTVSTRGFPMASLSKTGTLPGGLTFVDNGDDTATISGTPAAGTGGVYTLTLQAANGIGTAATQTLTLTVVQGPAIISPANQTFTAGFAGLFFVRTSGYPTPAIALVGSLPTGVTFRDRGNGTGVLSGTPAAATGGVYNVSFTAANGVGSPAVQSFAFTVDEAPAFTNAASATFVHGQSNTFTVATLGYPHAELTATGDLPSGVTFIDNGDGTATLAGTPSNGSDGTYVVSFAAANDIGNDAAQSFTLTVGSPPTISSVASRTYMVGQADSLTVSTTGFPIAALSETGSLPNGLSFVDNGDGSASLAGTPATGTGGVYHLTINAENSAGPAVPQSFTLTVNEAPSITSGTGAVYTAGTFGLFTVHAAGFPVAAVSETGALPAGLSFVDNGDGTATLGGTPASGTGGTYAISIAAGNGIGSVATQTLTITVNQAPAITSLASRSFTLGAPDSFTVTTSGFPDAALTLTGQLPSGVNFVDNGDGTASLTGIPATGSVGAYSLTVVATNGTSPNATQAFTLTVLPAPVTITLTTATLTYNGSPQSATATTSPAGVDVSFTYDGSSAEPTNAGEYAVVATSDDPDYTGNVSGTLVIAPATPTVAVTAPVNAVYDATPHGATAVVTGVTNGTDPGPATLTYFAGSTAIGSPLAGAPTHAGTYTVLASYGGSLNFTTASGTATYTIARAAPTVSITTPVNAIYNLSVHGATASVTGVTGGTTPESATLVYFAGTDTTGAPLSGAPSLAGTYTVRATFAGDTDYEPASQVATYTIGRATPTLTITAPNSVVYNAASHGVAANVIGVSEGLATGPATITYFAGSDTTGTQLPGAPTEAGTYTARAVYDGNSQYVPVTRTATYAIGQAPLSLSIIAPTGVTYDGVAHGAIVNVTGVSGGATPVNPTVHYFAGSGTSGQQLSGAPIEAGTYTVEASENGNVDYQSADQTATYTIAPAAATVTITTPTGAVYDAAAHGAIAVVSGVDGGANPGVATLTYYVGTVETGTLLSGAPTGAGAYTVRAAYPGNADYAPSTQTAAYSIARASAAVSISTPTGAIYDGSAKPATATITGVSNGTSPGSSTLTYFAGSEAGGTPLSVAPVDAGVYTVRMVYAGTADYSAVTQTATYTIARATPTVRLMAIDLVYNGSPQPATATVTGVTGGVDVGTATFTYYAGPDAVGTPLSEPPTAIGVYTVQATSADSTDYIPVVATATYRIFGVPTAGPITGTGRPGTDVVLNPLSNAASTDGGTLSFTLLTQPALGSATVTTVGGIQQVVYNPGPGAFFTDSFTYQVNDSLGGSIVSTATINYVGVGTIVSSLNPGAQDLVYIGSAGDHAVSVTGKPSKLKVTLDGIAQGTYAVTGRMFGFARDGNNTINAKAVTTSLWFYGGAGNNTFVGGSGGDVFIGGTGNDNFNGRTGKNFLIGGGGSNTLNGSKGTDILVAGATVYDAPTLANQSILLKFLSDWQTMKKRPNLPLANSGLGGSGTPSLNASTITKDEGSDILIGNKNSWFFGDFTFNGGKDIFNDGRRIKLDRELTPLTNERVTRI